MERAIVGFHLDPDGDWVADLACGHRQHVRHRPPFQPRPWVLEPVTRAERIGAPLECPLCDRDEPPASGTAATSVDAPGTSAVDAAGADGDEGGDTACWAHLLCEECGAVLDGGPHRPGCTSAAG